MINHLRDTHWSSSDANHSCGTATIGYDWPNAATHFFVQLERNHDCSPFSQHRKHATSLIGCNASRTGNRFHRALAVDCLPYHRRHAIQMHDVDLAMMGTGEEQGHRLPSTVRRS